MERTTPKSVNLIHDVSWSDSKIAVQIDSFLSQAPHMSDTSRILAKCQQELNDLDIPSYFSPSATYTVPSTSPLVTKLRLSKINDELKNLRLAHINDQGKYRQEIAPIQSILDERAFVNDQIIQLWIEQHTPKAATSLVDLNSVEDDDVDEDDDDVKEKKLKSDFSAADLENLTSLRKRLLTSNPNSMLDKTNDYHDSIQEDILLELSGFATSLKDSAMRLSSKIVEDATIVEKTNENLLKNSDLMGLIDKNLNNYVLNKTGGKISFWFLMKVLVGVFVLFFLMVALIKIFPKM